MTPAILKTTGPEPMIIVPEQWGATTEDALADGSIRMELPEILSRFSQTYPVEDQRLAGEVSGPSEILAFGRLAALEVRLLFKVPSSVERYRIHSQAGWIHGVFEFNRYVEVAVLINHVWTTVLRRGLL